MFFSNVFVVIVDICFVLNCLFARRLQRFQQTWVVSLEVNKAAHARATSKAMGFESPASSTCDDLFIT